jgi:phosphate transport system substrate-binding protein
MRSLALLGALGLGLSLALASETPGPIQPYQPAAAITGAVSIWGSPTDARLLQAWAEGFRKFHPDAKVVLTLHGPESAMMGVYTSVADVAVMARELRIPAETMAFTWAWRYAPTLIEVANAGIGSGRPNGPVRIWTNEHNPVTGLTLAQLDSIFGAENKRGGSAVVTWGDLGASGDWASRPVHRYGPAIDSVSGLFFRSAVLDGSYKWHPELNELPSAAGVISAVAADPAGIGYGSEPAPAKAGVRALALAATHGDAMVRLTAESAQDRTYPLARTVLAVVNCKPGVAMGPKAREFLSFALSEEGQALVASAGGCLPLTAGQLAAQRENLK